MKTVKEIIKSPRLIIESLFDDGGTAYAHLASSRKPRTATVVFTWSGGWEHVSVSFKDRVPTWEEMCEVKKMFFLPEETAVQYHPAESEYVNTHPYCLHLWRCIDKEMPTPPSFMVGLKKGQSYADAMKEAQAYA